ncbi:MAG: hypothetical protein ABR572_11005 [Cryomorphaceae bacterium]|nr:hypothetical protein [Flavobacteriales bacterium]
MTKASLVLMCVSAFSVASCSSDDDQEPLNTGPSYFTATYDVILNSMGVDSEKYADATALGSLQNPNLTQASGLAVSRRAEGLLWSHNDSGDMNRIFLLGSDGSNRGIFRVLGSGNRDWEDMAIGDGPEPGVPYLYIGDFGDNNKVYSEIYIYRFPEPDPATADTSLQWRNVGPEGVDQITLKYPDGPRDAESLLLDPLTLDLYIVTKSDFPARIYRLEYPYEHGESYTLELYGTLPVTLVTGGAISADGKKILLKTKERIWLWSRTTDESLADAFMRAPERVPYLPEPQGEAIAFLPDDYSYYTLSERGASSLPPVVYFYERLR